MTAGRRIGDADAHAHKRTGDDIPRLHYRLTERLDANDEIITELMRARFEMLAALREVKDAVQKLADDTSGVRELEGDVVGMMRLLARVNRFLGVLWKPLLFVAVAGASAYLWAKGVMSEKFP